MIPATPTSTCGCHVNRAQLRRALGHDDEILEALEAKASGRPSVNVGRVWSIMTSSVYKSGDLPIIGTREALQNGLDAIKAAIRARKTRAGEGRFAVTWDPSKRAITWEDNGIGMDADTILTKFLSLGDTGKGDAADSGEAAGGFGVAKAVILGTSSTFRWEMHTRDNLAVSHNASDPVQIYPADYLQGTRITCFDVPTTFDAWYDDARGDYVDILERLREVLGANDLPDIELTLNGEVVRPLFSRRGGSKVELARSWGDGTTAAIKAYRRPPGDRRGAYYIRLGGLYQHKTANRRGNLKADIVIDLTTTVRPGERGYPLNVARDALQGSAMWAFEDLVVEVERESESTASSRDYDIYDPESSNADEREGVSELGQLAEEAFADPLFQKALAAAAGGIEAFYAEREKHTRTEAPIESAAPAGSRPADGDAPTRGPVLPPGMKAAATALRYKDDIAAPASAAAAAQELREVIQTAVASVVGDAGNGSAGLPYPLEQVLDRAAAGAALSGGDVELIHTEVDRAARMTLEPGGGGILQAATVLRTADHALAGLVLDETGAKQRRERKNPFGQLAGLRIARKTYNRQRSYRFRKNFQKWIPHLTAWDATLRLVAAEARIRRRFKPGFVLDDETIGLTADTASGIDVIYINPDRFADVIKAHRERPIAIAAFLHGVACHELTHLDGRMGDGHDESFVVAREDLGHATGHLLPAIAVLVQRVLDLPTRPTDEMKEIATLRRQLARAQEARRGGRASPAVVTRLERELAEARAELARARAESARWRETCETPCATCACVANATRDLDELAEKMRAMPADIPPQYVEAFIRKNRASLLAKMAQRGASEEGAP
jgi:predicted RNA-binding Zn ribbon-like protein